MINRTNTHQKISTVRCLVVDLFLVLFLVIAEKNKKKLIEKYRALADKESNVIFGGRLGNYKYYDMDKVIEAALALVNEEL